MSEIKNVTPTKNLVKMEECDNDKPAETIIIAPHPDDEIIGTYSILKMTRPMIIYTTDMDNDRKAETLKLKEHFDIKAQLYLKTIPQQFLVPSNTFYIPDPIYEVNPDHRLQGAVGEQLVRAGLNVIFYSVNMQAPYCHNVSDPDEKEKLLNEVYPSQKSLWEYEKKYILFEGRCKWLL